MIDFFDPLNTTAICRTFAGLAIRTWNDLRDGYNYFSPIGEESITDFNILTLNRLHPDEVISYKFDKWTEEPITGADWEWWFVSSDDYFGVRVQAKKLKSGEFKYYYMDEDSGSTGIKQYDQLIKMAAQDKCHPLYCFYNYWDIKNSPVIWNCQTFNQVAELLGCSIADAHRVKKEILSNKTPHIRDMGKISWPWMCVVCCHGYSDPDANLPKRVRDFISNIADREADVPDVTKEPPFHVQAILSDSNKNEISGENPFNLAGILVIKEQLGY